MLEKGLLSQMSPHVTKVTKCVFSFGGSNNMFYLCVIKQKTL